MTSTDEMRFTKNGSKPLSRYPSASASGYVSKTPNNFSPEISAKRPSSPTKVGRSCWYVANSVSSAGLASVIQVSAPIVPPIVQMDDGIIVEPNLTSRKQTQNLGRMDDPSQSRVRI